MAVEVGFQNLHSGKTHRHPGVEHTIDPGLLDIGERDPGGGGGRVPTGGHTFSSGQVCDQLERVDRNTIKPGLSEPPVEECDYDIKSDRINLSKGGRVGAISADHGLHIKDLVTTPEPERSVEAWCETSAASHVQPPTSPPPGDNLHNECTEVETARQSDIDQTQGSKPGNVCESHSEKELLSKFRHIYAGKGGLFGVRSRSSTSAKSGIRTTVSIKVTKGGLRDSREETMPRAQYEKYKKEIMRKLAETIQNHEEKEKERALSESQKNLGGLNKSITEVNNNRLLESDPKKGAMLSNKAANIAVPASWRLPVSWAGRNKGFFGSERNRMQRLRNRENGELTEKRNATNNSHKQDNRVQRKDQMHGFGYGNPSSNPNPDVGSGQTFKERSLFTKSWLESSFSNRKPGGNENKDPNLRIGHLLNGLQAQAKDHDVDSSLATPSAVQTDIPRLHQYVTSPQALGTARTAGNTVHSFPRENGTEGRKNNTKNARPLGVQKAGVPPVSSRQNMNMYSRMSLEAQAALKEMGLAAQDISSSSSSSSEEDADDDDDLGGRGGSSGEEEESALIENIIQTKTQAMNLAQQVNGQSGMRGNRSAVPNLRNNHPDLRINNSTFSYVYNNRSTTESNNPKLINRRLQDKPTITKSSAQTSNTDDSHVYVSNINIPVPGRPCRDLQKTPSSSRSGEEHGKECSCNVRTGVLKTTTGREKSITVRVKSNCSMKSNQSRDSPQKEYVAKIPPSDGTKTRTKLPNIKEISPSGSAAYKTENSASTTPFLGTHRQIPGIGQYKVPDSLNKPTVITNWKREQTFEITPVGYDSRFEDIRTKEEELDETPEEVKLKAIAKCSDWLKKYL